jgi:hypothetical protein
LTNKIATYRQAQSKKYEGKKNHKNICVVNTGKRLTKMSKQSIVVVKDANIPTDCTDSRNTSFRRTGLKIKIYRKIE